MKKKELIGGNEHMALTGDPLAVAKQQINAEKIKHEVKHLTKNRTTDYVMNPHHSKYTLKSQSLHKHQIDIRN